MNTGAIDGPMLIIYLAFVAGASFGLTFGILITYCWTAGMQRKTEPFIPPPIIERVPEYRERIVEVEKLVHVSYPVAPSWVHVGLTKDAGAYHDINSAKCNHIRTFIHNRKETKGFLSLLELLQSKARLRYLVTF